MICSLLKVAISEDEDDEDVDLASLDIEENGDQDMLYNTSCFVLYTGHFLSHVNFLVLLGCVTCHVT